MVFLRLYFKRIFWVAVVLAGIAQAPPVAAQDFEFNAAWEQVRQKSHVLKSEQANMDQAAHQQSAARDLYLPQITLSAGYLCLDEDITLGPDALFDSMPAGTQAGSVFYGLLQRYHIPPGQASAGLTSTISERNIGTSSVNLLWPVYTGGRITAAQKIANALVDEAQQQHELKIDGQFETLCQRYFGVVLTGQILAARIEAEESLKLHFEHAGLLVKNGQIAEVERLQAEASHDRARVDRQKTASDLDITQAALTRFLQEETTVRPTTGLFVNPRLPLLETITKKTLTGYAGLAILDAKEKMATGRMKVEEGKYYPEVALVGNYNLYEEKSLAADLMPDWVAGISVSLPLIDRSGRSGKVKAAKSQIAQVAALRRQARQDLVLVVEKTYGRIEQAIAEHGGLASSLQLAEKTVELREKAFAQGLSTSLDVVDARLYVAGVKIQRAHAAYTYVMELAKLLAISGQINEFTQYYQASTLKD
ncbi:MAG: TolC family protein [Proteobacteria bacterium]|nr:TolC family protein [Pseudomonadota bacterium]